MSNRTRAVVEVTAVAALVFGVVLSAGASGPVVVQRQRAFEPPAISVKAGDRIVFINADTVTHNVYSQTPGMEFEIRAQAPGRSEAIRFDRAGDGVVECAIHPAMKLKLRVTP